MSDKYDPDELISLPEGTEFESGLRRLMDPEAESIEDAGEDEDPT